MKYNTTRKEVKMIRTIRFPEKTEKQIKDIQIWLNDLPFTDLKKPSISEVVRTCINYYWNKTIKEDQKI